MARQRSSWGSNSPARRKGYRVLRYWADTHDGTGYRRRTETIRGSKRDGDAELAALRVKYGEQGREGPRPTMEQCWKAWYVPEMEERLADGTIRKPTVRIYRNEWKQRVGPRWGKVLFTDVDPVEYQKWLLSLPNTQTARLSNVLVGNLVKCAVMHGVRGIEFKKVSYKLPRDSRERTERNAMVYNLEQLTQLVEDVRGTIMEVPAILCGLASCRVGESCAVMVDDLSTMEVEGMEVAVVRIDKQLSHRGRDLIPVKNEQSNRPVIVPAPWSRRLVEIARERRERGEVFLNDNGCGEPVTRAMVSQRWREFFRAGKTSVGYLPLQKLRNSWQTVMRWELGVDPDKVDRMMGHAGGDVRAKYYDRPDEIMFAETVTRAFLGRRYPDDRDK